MTPISVKKTVFVAILGVTPLAIENSILSFFKTHEDHVLAHLLVFSSTKGILSIQKTHGGFENWIEKIVQDAAQMGLENIPQGITHQYHEISEYDVDAIREKIFLETSAFIKNLSSTELDEIVVDITGGRKAMSIGAFLSALMLEQEFSHFSVLICYYWLKHAQGNYLQKHISDLFPDEFEVKTWIPKEMNSSISG